MTTGLYLGKFAPFHGGHKYCLDQALDDCDHVIVLVYWTNVIDTPLQTRAGWIRELYDDTEDIDGATIDVIEAWAGPDSHGYTPEIKREHEEYVGELLEQRGYTTDDIDAFYSSEPYGKHMSEYLDAEDRRVDPDRETMPISGTLLRDGDASLSHWVPARVRGDLVERVAIVGGVSSGKTTLARELADEFETEWMPEYGRKYWNEHADDNGRLTEDQLVDLALTHATREDEIASDANRYLFVDTTPLTTLAWAKYYHNEEPPILQSMACHRNKMYGTHVLCDPDIPFEDEQGREGRRNRKRLHRIHVGLMEEYGIDYITVSGSVEERVEQVKSHLE